MTDKEKFKFMKENKVDFDFIPVYDNKLNLITYKTLADIKMWRENGDVPEELGTAILQLGLDIKGLKREVVSLTEKNKELKELLKEISKGLGMRWKK